MEQLLFSILQYIQNDKANYAVMIDGKWGSGKTYFLKNRLIEEIEKIDVGDKKCKVIYISLYGISSIEEINRKVFVETMISLSENETLKKLASNKKVSKGFSIAKKVIELGSEYLPKGFADLVKSVFSLDDLIASSVNIGSNIVLSFDDLERTQLDLGEILGYINSYVEQYNVKTIIIANQTEIQQQHEYYERIKEKLIGKTFLYTLKFGEIANSIIKEFQNDKEYYEFLNSYFEQIVSICEISEAENIRSLKTALDDFNLIFNKVKNYYSEIDEESLLFMMRLTLALTFEIKKADFKQDALENIRNSRLHSLVSYMSGNKKTVETDEEKFVAKYFKYDFIFKKINYDFIIKFICKGFFDEELMKTELHELIKPDEVPNYAKLLYQRWWELEDNEFEEAIKIVINKVENGDLKLEDYYQAGGILHHIRKRGLINIEINNIIFTGLERLRIKTNTIEYTLKNELEVKMRDKGNFGLEQEELQSLEKIKNKILEINDSIYEIQRNKEIEKDFNDFLHETVNGYELFNKYSHEPVFHTIDIEVLLNSIKEMTNRQLSDFVNNLKDRYDNINNNRFLHELNNLKKIMKELIVNENISINNFHLVRLKDVLENAITGIENTKSDKYVHDSDKK